MNKVTQDNKIILEEATPVRIFCKHCHKEIKETIVVGVTLICPHCGKPGNGDLHTET
jgi:Zn finger protein HypA/HybF involved in hydrogenase expression